MIDFTNILIGITALINLSLSVWIYWKRRENSSALWFSAFTFSLVIWCIAIIGTRIVQFPEQANIWGRLLYGSGLLIAISVFIFANAFPKLNYRLSRKLKLIVFVPLIILLATTSLTDYVIEEVKIPLIGEKRAEFGPLYSLYLVYMISYLGAALYLLFGTYLRSKGVTRAQALYVFLGFFFFIVIGSTTNLILPTLGYFEFWAIIGPVSTIIMVSFISYALVKQGLFGIKLVLTALLVSLIAILLLFNIFIPPTQLFKSLLLVVFLYFGYLLIKSVLKEIALRTELEKAYAELEKLDKAKSEFISIASHQLRTPLTAIKGYISLIREKTYGVAPGKMKRPLKNIYISTERLIKLVNDLLNISRIEAGKIELKLEKLSLGEVISTVVEELKPIAQEKSIYLKWEKDKEPLSEISLDREKIRQVILNIVDNGIRYTYAGGVMIRCQKTDGKYLVSITDTGEGLTKNEISSLFKTFTRGSAGQRLWTEGVGLGLYIAKKFLELHNGKIWVESPGKGQGSTFYIEIPIK